MTNTMVLERQNKLILPSNYEELNREEMTYVEGGISVSSLACIIDLSLFLVVGAVNTCIRAAGFMCRGAARAYMKRSAPKWAKKLLACSVVVKTIQGYGGDVGTFMGMFSDVSPWIDRVIDALSVGGLIATALDFMDGSFDGHVRF